jgi:hypothetical protein
MPSTLDPLDVRLANAKASVVTIGSAEGHARGFVVEVRRAVPPHPNFESVPFATERLVLTAAHCLPSLPPPHPWSYSEERTFVVLGPLGAEPNIAAECLFVDLVADVAVLGPDNQSDRFSEHAERYSAFVDDCATVTLGTISGECPAFLLTRAMHWESCRVRANLHGPATNLVLLDATDGTAPGCSGSPIIIENGSFVGLVSVGSLDTKYGAHGQPWLARVLPAWLVELLMA